jgi:predicted RNase H-like nuclease (RuvC/YqgF family)
MKKILVALAVLLSSYFAQAQAYDSQIDYKKKNEAGVTIEYKIPQGIVEDALKKKLENLGLKIKNSKGFMVAFSAVINSISSNSFEYAFQVDRKSKREKETTVINVVMLGNEVNATPENASKVKEFLNELGSSIEAAYLESQIKEQEEVVAKNEKKNRNLVDDIASLEKKIRNLQEDLAKTKREQEEQAKEVTRQQEILNTIKAKRK